MGDLKTDFELARAARLMILLLVVGLVGLVPEGLAGPSSSLGVGIPGFNYDSASTDYDLGAPLSLDVTRRGSRALRVYDRPSEPRRGRTAATPDFVATKGAEGATRLLGPGTSFGSKIEGQLARRGWTKRLVQSTIDDPASTMATRDTRFLPGGSRMDDPATGYISRRGGYVICNDRTGDVVQVSKRTDPNWRAPWNR